MDWTEIILQSIRDNLTAVFIFMAFGAGRYICAKRKPTWQSYAMAIGFVLFISIGLAANLGGGNVIDGPDLFAPGGIRDSSSVRPGYPSKHERYAMGLRILFTYSPAILLGVYLGKKNKNE